MKHRPEIDGLRAIAVGAVILFHAGFPRFSGGFVGVDVFFVISGYLITDIIATALDTGQFSLATFYERRARRILPALFTVMVVCAPFAALWLVPEDRKEFAQSVAAVTLFASNILFWSGSGYFDSAAELKPLLHTWSLAVEEQFYVLFPLLLMVLWRIGKRAVLPVLIIAAVASIVLADWAAASRPSAAFFLLPTRAWELLVGAIVAVYLRNHPAAGPSVAFRNLSGAVGLACVLGAIGLFDSSTPVPGFQLLLPTLGTASIILFARGDTAVGKLLSGRYLVKLGLMSYSAYLWHQPVFAFARHRAIDDPGPVLYGALCVLVFVLSYLTWRFIEQPFRDRARVSRPLLFRFSLATTAMFLMVGGAGASMIKPDVEREETGGRCNANVANCFAVRDARYRVALWGDSYADAFARRLADRLRKHNISLFLFVKHSCPSLLGTVRNEPRRLGGRFGADCEEHNRQALQALQTGKFDVAILTSAYQWYLDGKNDRGEPVLLDRDHPALSPQQFLPGRLRDTIRAIPERTHVVTITPHPLLKNFRKTRKELFFGLTRQDYADFDEATRVRGLLLSGLDGVPFDEVDGRGLFCVGDKCPVVDGGHLRLYDGSHLSPAMASRLADDVVRVVLRRLD